METTMIVIRCPHCQFSKSVASDKLPSERKKITCPSCHEKFEYVPGEKIFEQSVTQKVKQFITEQNTSNIPVLDRTKNEYSNHNLSTKINIFAGTMLTVSSFLPAGILFNYITKGMYGPFFRKFSPSIFHIVNVSFSLIISAILVTFIFKSLRLFARLHKAYTSDAYFITGNSLMIIYLAVRIFSSSIPGGGPPLAVTILGVIPVFIAKIFLTIGVVRVLIGIDPTK